MAPSTRRPLRLLIKVGWVCGALLLVLELVLRLAGAYYRAEFWRVAGTRATNESAITILALGESTTAGLWLPIADSYPKQLERKLREHYDSDRIAVMVPPHIGQNTSQMLHRFDAYLGSFHPALVLIMAGVNDTWSLAESDITEFLPTSDWRKWLLLTRRFSDDLKVVRFVRLLISGTEEAWRSLRSDLEGQPHFTSWPPPDDPLVKEVGLEVFMRLWRADVGAMIERAKAAGADVVLMTYPNYDVPSLSEFEALAESHSVPLVRNDASFAPFIDQGRGPELFFEDMRHPNAAGYAIVAENAYQSVLALHSIERRLHPR